MKTALGELKQWVINHLPPEQEQTRRIKDQINNLIKKEKEQMSACFQNGYVEGISEHNGLTRKYQSFDDYYNTNFEVDNLIPTKEQMAQALFKKKDKQD